MGTITDQLSGMVASRVKEITPDRIFEWTIGNRLFEMGELGASERVASWFGYGSLLALLGSMLGLQLMGSGVPAPNPSDQGTLTGTPVPVVVIACIGFVAAWALIMTGVLYARRAVAILFIVGFAIQLIVVGARVVYLSLSLVALAIFVQVLFRDRVRQQRWSQLPVISLLAWVLLLTMLLVVAWRTALRFDTFVSQITSVMSMTSVFALGLWITMACGAVVSAVRLSTTVMGFVRARASLKLQKMSAILMTVLVGPGALLFGVMDRDPAWIMCGVAGLILIPVIIILILAGRLNARTSSVIIGLGIAILLFAFSLSLAMSNSTRIGRGIQATGIFPPVLLFLVLAADNLLRFGKPIKRVVPRVGSRVAWVLVYLGGIVLVLASLLFLMNHPSTFTGRPGQPMPEVLAGISLATMLVTGPTYLAWVVLRRSVWWSGQVEPVAEMQ